MPIVQFASIAFVTSLILTFFVTPFVVKLAKYFELIDDPTKNKHPKAIHTYPVPRAGGIAVFLGFITSVFIFFPIDKHLTGIIIGATIIVALGVLDDKYNLSPYLRLLIGFLAAAFPIASGIGIAFLTNPLGGIINLTDPQFSFYLFGETRSIWVLSDLFALFWIVFMMNMLNMGAKGVDGQLPGVISIAALTISALSLRFSADITQWPVVVLSMIVAGAFAGFLPWNFYPQKIMPGYSGSTLGGYLLAVLSILSTTKVGTLTVVLAVPLIDTLYTMTRRVLEGKSPVWGDTGHLHHRLLKIGWSKRQVAFFYWLITGFLGALALNLNSEDKLYTIIAVIVLLGASILWLANKAKHK